MKRSCSRPFSRTLLHRPFRPRRLIRPRRGASSTPSLSDFSGVPAMKRSRARPKRSRARRSMTMEAELIPGLPDCLALQCLLRLPFHAILNARTVCKRWKHEFDSPSFYRIRRAAGLGPRVVSLLLRGKLPHTRDKFHLALYEPDTDVCIMRQLAPDRPMMRPLTPDLLDLGMTFNSTAAVIGRELVVIGGCDAREDRDTGEVNFYDLVSGAWRPGAPNPAPDRYFCRKVMNGGKILFIGGYDDEEKKLQSALVYDVDTDIWLEIPDLGQDTCQGTSIDGGKLCDKFWQSKEEYNTVIQRCREELLLVDEEDDVIFCRTEEDKEVIICVPKRKKSEMEIRFILNEKALRNLRRRLGILPKEVGRYIESFYSGLL